ncbi:MAG: hypothetical protein R8M46_05935 [Ghiorsea sp.]
MNLNALKPVLVGLLVIWLLLFSIDSIFGIDWPSYAIERIFIWTPTVLIAAYWLLYGGAKKKDDK